MNNESWHTSSYSNANGGHCVEVSEGLMTCVRDTQNRGQGHLSVPAHEWDALLNAVRS
ncbi:DUF397 domain-containing protein [Nocardiopsis kunsanensis]|uniref:DUF397 domain-containing protein n=1 Tax=Nocardiopsis kunsanensis TaxID=141693 RepID=A0A918XLD4_9ACTN|nr:DUF397 domain-containing protein [Nocardiopsis kunsanensis]GHD37442.1 hypothetical protein GCM10007147_45490 [Nocardiopsis kunsanensis]